MTDSVRPLLDPDHPEHSSFMNFTEQAAGLSVLGGVEMIRKIDQAIGALEFICRTDADVHTLATNAQNFMVQARNALGDQLFESFELTLQLLAPLYPEVEPPFERWFSGKNPSLFADSDTLYIVLRYYPLNALMPVLSEFNNYRKIDEDGYIDSTEIKANATVFLDKMFNDGKYKFGCAEPERTAAWLYLMDERLLPLFKNEDFRKNIYLPSDILQPYQSMESLLVTAPYVLENFGVLNAEQTQLLEKTFLHSSHNKKMILKFIELPWSAYQKEFGVAAESLKQTIVNIALKIYPESEHSLIEKNMLIQGLDEPKITKTKPKTL